MTWLLLVRYSVPLWHLCWVFLSLGFYRNSSSYSQSYFICVYILHIDLYNYSNSKTWINGAGHEHSWVLLRMHCAAESWSPVRAPVGQSPRSVRWRSDKRASIVFTLQTLFLFYRELIEMLAISINQKLLQSGEENQVSGFSLDGKQKTSLISSVSCLCLFCVRTGRSDY